MNNCYEGISVPPQISEPCGNSYMSTNCVTIPAPIFYLDLPIASSQTLVNDRLILALQAANEKIQELLDRVELLEGI